MSAVDTKNIFSALLSKKKKKSTKPKPATSTSTQPTEPEQSREGEATITVNKPSTSQREDSQSHSVEDNAGKRALSDFDNELWSSPSPTSASWADCDDDTVSKSEQTIDSHQNVSENVMMIISILLASSA